MRQYVFFAVFFLLAVPVFADAEGMCGGSFVPVQRTNGKTVCLTEGTAEVLAERLGWIVIDPVPYRNNNVHTNPVSPDDTVIPDRTSESNNDFALNFYDQISDNNKNIFFSPLSMYAAFSMLYEGAEGNTADEIRDVFGFEGDDAARAADTTSMISSINREDQYATLELSNAIWPADWFNPYESYVQVIRDVYRGEVERVSFVSPPDEPEGVKRINQWAAEKTNDKITEVITPKDVDNLTAMVLTNAVYFKGTWLTQFSEEDTAESDFWTNDSDSVRVDYMNMENAFEYAGMDGMKIIKMPYKGDRLSMLVLLPDERDGINHLEESISVGQIRQWSDTMTLGDVIVKMPKFEIKTNYDLKPELKKLGMLDVFVESGANLSGIADVTDRNLYVSSATHDAFVKINEEGTEAAAVTSMLIYNDSIPPSPPRFIADHPFIFIIQDDASGAILFMGRISDPTI